MADALVERRPSARFFCHRCNIEFEDVLQDYVCPYCASGFIEQLESEAEGSILSDDVSDADMSNLDDSDDMHQSASHPMLNDLAFLMTGGRLRGAARPESLLEQLVWTIGGGAGGGAITAGAPFVLVGAPGDYVFGGEGLDAVVTQLLGQLENAGPPPLPRDQIDAIPSEAVTPEQAAANTSCSVCWDNFQQGETVSRLECDHIFHSTCIEPWLQLHATCPICRRSLLPEEQQTPETPNEAASQPVVNSENPPTQFLPVEVEVEMGSSSSGSPGASTSSSDGSLNITPLLDEVHDFTTMIVEQSEEFTRQVPRVLLRRLPRRLVSGLQTQTWDSPPDSSSSSGSVASNGSSVTAGGLWAPRTSAPNSTNSNSSSSINDRTSQYNMDIDFD